MGGKRFWLSWWHHPDDSAFELHAPWWIIGEDLDDRISVCAAVMADDDEHARRIVVESYDEPPSELEFRFVSERSESWTPFRPRFPRAEWMTPDALRHWRDDAPS